MEEHSFRKAEVEGSTPSIGCVKTRKKQNPLKKNIKTAAVVLNILCFIYLFSEPLPGRHGLGTTAWVCLSVLPLLSIFVLFGTLKTMLGCAQTLLILVANSFALTWWIFWLLPWVPGKNSIFDVAASVAVVVNELALLLVVLEMAEPAQQDPGGR